VLLVGIGGGDLATAQEAQETPQATELPKWSTATSDTYRLPDGLRETVIYQAPVNFKDGDGQWKPIVEELEQQPDGSGLSNGANSFDLLLPERMGDGAVRLDTGDAWVSQELLGTETTPAEVEGSTATYGAEGEGVSIELTSISAGVKETIELGDASQPRVYRFRIDASSGVTPILTEAGSIEFRDEDEELVAEIPAPFLEDSSQVPQTSSAVHYELSPDDSDAWILTVDANSEWLSDPDRVWPVKIDPTTVAISASLSCQVTYVVWSYADESSGSCTKPENLLQFKRTSAFGTPTIRSRALMKFGLGAIPSDAALMDASLSVYHTENAAPLPTRVELRALTKAWDSSVTWERRTATQYWSTPGGDFNSELSEIPPSSMGVKPGWLTFQTNMRDLVNKWVNDASTNNGVVLRVGNETACSTTCDRGSFSFQSASYPSPEGRPQLKVLWYPEAPSDSKITSPTDGTKSAKRFVLKSAWEHSGVDGVTFQYKTNGGWNHIPPYRVIDGDGKALSTWPYGVPGVEDRESRPLYWDASYLTAGSNSSKAKVQIRAVLSGSPGAEGYTQPVMAEIDGDTGGSKDATAPIGPGTVNLLTGNFTVSRTDVSIPAFNSTLEFSRSFNSREAGVEATGVLGPGWKPAAPLEEAGGASWTKLVLKEESEEFEEEGTFTYKWAELTHSEGDILAFEDNGSPQYITPPEMSGYVLYRLNPNEIAFTDPAGNRTVFHNGGSGNEYLPISVAMTGGPGNKSRMIYEFNTAGKRRLKRLIAPAAPGVTCSDEGATSAQGCKVLSFSYQSPSALGTPAGSGDRLTAITYDAAGHGGPWQIANYSYDSQGRLTSAWDPRITPALKETYSYGAGGQIATLTPPGQEPWTMSYTSDPGVTNPGRLVNVKRATLDSANPTAQTTIVYNRLLSGSGAPYDMSAKAVAAWGQEDLPADATVIFPPDEVPASPPSSYTRATAYYMDAEGQLSNVATPSGAGTSAPSITTTETDEFGNVIRELTAQNRLRALAAGAGSVAKSRELDTQFRYSKDGTELQEEVGPMHQVRLESGTVEQARLHRSIQYDAAFKYINGTTTPSPGETKPHLPTTVTTGALLAGGSVVDKRSTAYTYNWTLRAPTETLNDPGGTEELKSVTIYNNETGLPTEVRQPKNAGGGGAGTTKFVYYKESVIGGSGVCESNIYAGLLCKTEPAAQPGTAGQPQLLVKKVLSYNQLGQPVEITESPGGGTENVRKAVSTYDAVGRQKTFEIAGGGVPIPKVETLYSTSTGQPTTQRIVCPASEPACDTQATTVTYDTLGRVKSFSDADGVSATTTYDFLGRPVTLSDGKGTQTMGYDSVTGLLVELKDSAAGTFTASYDADGQLVGRGLPNGLTAQTTFDETGSPVGLTYTKASSCGLSCTWLDFDVERSIRGQILLEDGTLGKDEYGYDKLGRLTTARETPAGGTCTTRTYKYDKDSNREEMTTRPGLGGVCSSSGGTTQKYCYDSADRLLGEGSTCEGVSYDSFGRITNLPAVFSGGKALATTYFSTDMVATQTQNGVTNSFQLDAMLRHRQRLQAGGLEGTEVFHYAGPGDSPSWTQRGSAWTRSIAGIGGELAAIQESGKEVTLQLTNLHGDVVARAGIDPAKTSLLSTFRHDEFGVPVSGEAGRYGWLGGKHRRTELSSGVIQMGARSYVPSLGRFLTPDPIFGGSANPYDYANQDPINEFDLEGTCSTKKKCAAKRKREVAKAHSRIDRIRDRMREARAARAERRRLGGFDVPEILPWEEEAQEALRKVDNSLIDIFTKDCGETSNTFFAIGGTATSTGLLLSKGGPAAAAVGGMLGALGIGAGIAGGIFWGADKANVC
jgi:RHS repeat-associated protein